MRSGSRFIGATVTKKQEYLGLVQGYLNDPRFVSYYDSAAGEGATEFLVQAIKSAHE